MVAEGPLAICSPLVLMGTLIWGTMKAGRGFMPEK